MREGELYEENRFAAILTYLGIVLYCTLGINLGHSTSIHPSIHPSIHTCTCFGIFWPRPSRIGLHLINEVPLVTHTYLRVFVHISALTVRTALGIVIKQSHLIPHLLNPVGNFSFLQIQITNPQKQKERKEKGRLGDIKRLEGATEVVRVR